MSPNELKNLIRTVPDYPQPGIPFRDISTLIDMVGACVPASIIWRIARIKPEQ